MENLSEIGDYARLGNIARLLNLEDFEGLGSALAKAGPKLGEALGGLGVVFDAVGMAFDIETIVEASKDLESGAKSPAAEDLRTQSTTLQGQKNKVDNIYSSLVKAAAQTKCKLPTGGEASGGKQTTPTQSSQQRARKQKEHGKEGGSGTRTEPEEPKQTNPKRGHHVFNNVPKLIRDSIDEYFKNNLQFWSCYMIHAPTEDML